MRALYDPTHLYFAIRCWDSEPEKIRARAIFRDESAGADDLVSIMLDSFNDHRSAIQFVTNANGLIEDLLQTGESTSTRNINWDTVWDSNGRRTDFGWEVEIAIPFHSLRFPSPAPGAETVFGIGFKRNIPRKNEEVYWPFVANDSSWYRPAELGTLRGLRDISPGRSLELRPYGLVGVDHSESEGATETRLEAGIDVKWGVTEALTADFTLNTDFAQEEVDTQQINFTRFSLFFPEKRQFFLEGQRMFQFGIPREVDLVFTRRIGLSAAGDPIRLLGGGRLSGRQGTVASGLMSLQTDDFESQEGENFSVVRVRKDLFARSTVGAVFTSRAGAGSNNQVAGADISLFFKKVWFLEGFVARVFEEGGKQAKHAGYARFAYDTDRFELNHRYLDLGQDFRPGIGFVRRPDSRENRSEFRYSPRTGWEGIRQFHARTSLRYVTNQENELETRERTFSFATNFESGDALTVRYDNRLEALTEPFLLNRDVSIRPGTYRTNTWRLSLDTFAGATPA